MSQLASSVLARAIADKLSGSVLSDPAEIAREIDAAINEHAYVIGVYAGKDGHRDWWTGGAWLYIGDKVVVV